VKEGASLSMVVVTEELGIVVEFERTTKMEHEKETENDHFCKVRVGFNFTKVIIFQFILVSF
jgi:hypothetical protein